MASITHAHEDSHPLVARASLALAARLIPASLALSAGAVHLAMSPIHAPGSTEEAIGFAAVGWAQIVLGIALLLRPGREALLATILLNAGVIAAYTISRTAGLPVGADPGVAESVGNIDLMVTMFEGVLVACAAVLFIRPGFADVEGGFRALSFEAFAVASAIPVLVLAVTSVGLSDPDLIQHGHGEAGSLVSAGNSHGGGPADSAQLAALADNRCDLSLNPAAYWRETSLAGIDTLTGGQNPGKLSTVQGSQELDKVVALHTTVEGEIGDAQMVLALSKVTDDVYDDWLRWLGASGKADHSHDANAAAPDDTMMGGHLGPQAWNAMTEQGECDALQSELALARDTALTYPTVADAKAAGWRQVTPYVPGIAAHFMNFSIVDDKFEIDKPEMILYDGVADDARVVGLSYYIRHDGDAEPTQGFAGTNDHYHRHIGLCVDASGVIGDSTTTEEECTAMGGKKANGGNGWMNHAWVVPGCESPWGVFSGASPILDGTLSDDAGKSGSGCAGSGTRARYNLDAGEVENVPTTAGGEMELASTN